MKHSVITLILSLLIITGFSQNPRFQYTGRNTPAIKKANLHEAVSVHEIMPEFARYFMLPYNERELFDKQALNIYPQSYFYPKEDYGYLFNYVSIEISTTSGGQLLTATGTTDELTPEQKDILNRAELGADISIKIKFRYKNDATASADEIKEGEYNVTVVPQMEALYPGGFKQFSDYLTENVLNKIAEPKANEKIQQAVLKFTVDEDGQVLDARIARSSSDPKIDELLIDAANKMPKWMPARNSSGESVKQEFNIDLGGGGC